MFKTTKQAVHPIEQARYQVAELVHIGAIPVTEKGYVDVVALAYNLGFKVLDADLDESISSMIRCRPGYDPEIYLNNNDTYGRRRYYCAWALGRYIFEAPQEEWGYIQRKTAPMSERITPGCLYAQSFVDTLLEPGAYQREF